MRREQQTREIQSKAQREREENKRKLDMSKRMISESRRNDAEYLKKESKKMDSLNLQGKMATDHEKRLKAEEERNRSEVIHRLHILSIDFGFSHFTFY